jgi:hypothetical protein
LNSLALSNTKASHTKERPFLMLSAWVYLHTAATPNNTSKAIMSVAIIDFLLSSDEQI